MEAFGTQGVPDADRVSCMTNVYVDDVDARSARARAQNAVIWEEVAEHFGGNRQYAASDLKGHR